MKGSKYTKHHPHPTGKRWQHKWSTMQDSYQHSIHIPEQSFFAFLINIEFSAVYDKDMSHPGEFMGCNDIALIKQYL